MIKKLPCKCNCVFEGVGESCSQITVMTSAFINTYFTMHFIRHIINTRLVEYVPTAYTLLNSWALCPRLIRIWRLNMIHYGNSFKIRLKVKFLVYKKRHYTSIEKCYSRLDDFIAIFLLHLILEQAKLNCLLYLPKMKLKR